MELQQYVAIVGKRWWLILATTVLAAGIAALVSFTATPVYRSTATLLVDASSDPYQDAYRVAVANEASAEAYALQVAGPAVAREVAARLGLAVEAIQGMISANHLVDTAMIEVSAQHTDPALAYAVAETTVEVFVEQTTAQAAQRYQDALAELEAQIAVLQAEITEDRIAASSYGDAATLTPAARAEQARLQTQIANNQTRLTSLLSSTEQFRLAIARASGGLAVFRPAAMPRAPFSPQPVRNTALAAVVGGMIGVGTAFLLDYLDDTVHAPEDTRRALGVTVLGAVPDVPEDRMCGWLPQAQPLSPAAEAFRDLRTSLQYASLDQPLCTLLVTSTEPGEGKSFVASNLATAMAVTGKQVLLLEADLRRPRVHELWGVDRGPGLSDALKAMSEAEVTAEAEGTGGGVLAAFLQPTRVDGLWLMPAGTKIATPAELLNSQTFQRALAALEARFDLIVMDSPPILTVTDAAVLTGRADGVMVVTAAGQTRLPLAARTLARVEEIGGNLLGIVINRLTARTGGYYYRAYQHGYGYGDPEPAGKGCDPAQDGASDVDAARPRPTHTVQRGTLTQEVVVAGVLAPAREAVLCFPVGGTLKAVHVTPGEAVAMGTLLAELDAPDEEARAMQAATDLAIARLERDKAAGAGDGGAIDVAIAEERLKLAEALHARAQARLADTHLVAAFDGTVVRFDKAPGDRVTPYAPVGRLAETGRLRLQGPLPPDAAGTTDPGSRVEVRPAGERDRVMAGTVTAVTEGGPGGAPVVTVEVVTTAATGAVQDLLGREAEAVLQTETRADVPWVPLRALVARNGDAYVDLQTENGETAPAVRRVRVELGLVTDFRAEVVSGVTVGDVIAYPT